MSDAHEHVRKFPLNVVLAALGFENWKWRKAGTEGFGACPIHGSKKNTTCFSFDDEGRFNCFSCSAKGKGAIDLVMAVKQCGFQQAVDFLKTVSSAQTPSEVCTQLPKQITPSATDSTPSENPPFNGTYEKYYVPSPWLAKRGFLPGTLAAYEVGQYDNPRRQSAYKGKILFPVRRWKDDELVAYLARNPEPKEGEPKYIWPKGFQKSLEVFGASLLKERAPLRVLYLVESPFCVMKFHQHGLPAVSCFGWCVSVEQCQILSELAKGICYLPDRDKSEEARRNAGTLAMRCWLKMPELPAGVDDPENLNAEQVRALS